LAINLEQIIHSSALAPISSEQPALIVSKHHQHWPAIGHHARKKKRD
jgi:hypothetical protein